MEILQVDEEYKPPRVRALGSVHELTLGGCNIIQELLHQCKPTTTKHS